VYEIGSNNYLMALVPGNLILKSEKVDILYQYEYYSDPDLRNYSTSGVFIGGLLNSAIQSASYFEQILNNNFIIHDPLQ
jgi:hypothetical protein